MRYGKHTPSKPKKTTKKEFQLTESPPQVHTPNARVHQFVSQNQSSGNLGLNSQEVYNQSRPEMYRESRVVSSPQGRLVETRINGQKQYEF